MKHARAHELIKKLLLWPETLVGKHPLLQIECIVDHGTEYSGDLLRRRVEVRVAGDNRPGMILAPASGDWVWVALDSYIYNNGWTRTQKGIDLRFDGSARRETDIFEAQEQMVIRHKGKVAAWRSGEGAVSRARTIEMVRGADPDLLDTDALDREMILLGRISWASQSTEEARDFVLRALRFASTVEWPTSSTR